MAFPNHNFNHSRNFHGLSLYDKLASSPSPDLSLPDMKYYHEMTSPAANMMTPSPAQSVQAVNGAEQYATVDDVVSNAWRKLEKAKKVNDERDAMLSEMIHRYEYVSRQNSKLHEELDKEKKRKPNDLTNNYLYKEDYETLKLQHDRLLQRIDTDSFVLVLIDGDGMVFHQHFLAQGEAGGIKAAEVLRNSTMNYARDHLSSQVKGEIKVVARMYANVRGLAEACTRAGLVRAKEVMEDFMRGFSNGDPLFDCVDVGPGTDRVDEKISELFKLHAYDYRCKHIVFGCSQGNGFARLLEKYIFDSTITTRVTLLEGMPFSKELNELPYNRARFGTIFRREPMVLPSAPTTRKDNAATVLHSPAVAIANGSGGPEQAAATALLRSMTHTPSESVSSFGGVEESKSVKTTATLNWATRAALAAAKTPPSPPVEKNDPFRNLNKDNIPRNRKGQRLDPECIHNKEEVERVRKMKMCNVHYLRKECKYGNRCTHKHDRTPNSKDLEVLKTVARYSFCRAGSACDDPRCIYGHHCQAPPRMDPAKWPNERGKTCIFGPDCVFPAELHNVDTTIVKFTKVGQ